MNFSAIRLYIKFPTVLIIFQLIAGIFLAFLPLIGKLGYENSAANSILLFIVFGFYSINYFKKEKVYADKPTYIYIDSKLILSIFLIIPFIIALIPTLIFSKCPMTDGLLFFITLVIPSSFLGYVTGYFSFVLSKKYSYIIFLFLFFALASISLLEFYFNPQIYFFNPIVGFLPGTIYDEDLKVDDKLLLYRGVNIILGCLLLYASKSFYNKSKLKRTGLFFSVIIIATVIYFLKPGFGFSTNVSRLEKYLVNRIKTEHFIINYSKPKEDFTDPMLIGLIHEYYYDQLVNELHLKSKGKIHSFIFIDSKQKRDLFGAGNADVAKPWLNQIYLNYDSYSYTVKHELVHVLAGRFGATPFKIAGNFNPAMIEGIAVAIENSFGSDQVHTSAKLAYQAGYKISIRNLFGGLNFFSQYSTISYLFAGSFIQYLIEKYGINKIKDLYTSADFEKIFGRNIAELEKGYWRFLETVEIDFNKNKAQLYFAGQPIFKKFCPRVAASQINKANEFYENKEFKNALAIYSDVYSYSESYQSLRGYINSLIELNRSHEALQILTREINKFKTSRYHFYLELMLADLCVRNDRIPNAIAMYDTLIAQHPHIDYVNNAMIKMELYSESTDSLKKYIISETKDKFEMLTRLNGKSIRYFSIPTLLNLCTDSSQVRQFCNRFINIRVKDFHSSYAMYSLSKAALSLNDFNLSKKFAVRALEFKSDKDYTFMLSQNLKMINWLNNYADEIKPWFIYR